MNAEEIVESIRHKRLLQNSRSITGRIQLHRQTSREKKRRVKRNSREEPSLRIIYDITRSEAP
jgi:hypothetical protein